MTKKEARIEALRICTGMIKAGIYLDDGYSEIDAKKIYSAMDDVANRLYRAAYKLGGDFNPLTGYEHGKKITI